MGSMDIQEGQLVPSGASTGKFEAVELRDGEKDCYVGLSVQKAVENVNTKLAEAILGENALNQTFIDKKIIDTDGTDNKSNVGANASLGVSMAVARAAAAALRIPLYQYLGGCHTRQMPVPDDEYYQRGTSRRQHRRSAGIHDHAGRCKKYGTCYPHVHRSISVPQDYSEA